MFFKQLLVFLITIALVDWTRSMPNHRHTDIIFSEHDITKVNGKAMIFRDEHQPSPTALPTKMLRVAPNSLPTDSKSSAAIEGIKPNIRGASSSRQDNQNTAGHNEHIVGSRTGATTVTVPLSIDDRGLFEQAPKCPAGQVAVGQHCRKVA